MIQLTKKYCNFTTNKTNNYKQTWEISKTT
jgi:hypothetical protein